MFIYFWERPSMSGGGAEREGDTDSKAGSGLSCQHTAQRGARTHELWDHDLSRSQTLNWLSHPGAPEWSLSKNKQTTTTLQNEIIYLDNPIPIKKCEFIIFKKRGGTWVSESVEHLTSAQVVISQFVRSSPALGSVLTAQSLEPAWILSLSLSVPPLLTLSLKNK